MSLCDKCYAPGTCCKWLTLETGDDHQLVIWDDEDPAVVLKERHHLPFEPVKRQGQWMDEKTGKTYSSWYWRCPILLPDGRCGDYENRPDLCRRFEPASGPLCVHYQGAEGRESGDIEELF